MKKILVGYDHTPSSLQALRWLDVFIQEEAEVILLFSCPVTTIASLEDEPTLDLIDREHQRLHDAVKGRDSRFSFTTRVSFDAPARSIVQVARTEHVDLVVVGSSNASGIAQFVVGTVANEVIRDVEVSVVVAKPLEVPAES